MTTNLTNFTNGFVFFVRFVDNLIRLGPGVHEAHGRTPERWRELKRNAAMTLALVRTAAALAFAAIAAASAGATPLSGDGGAYHGGQIARQTPAPAQIKCRAPQQPRLVTI